MKCPLIAVAIVRELGEPLGDEADCLKEECAWWLDNIQMCALKDLALETRHIQFRLQDMIEEEGGK